MAEPAAEAGVNPEQTHRHPGGLPAWVRFAGLLLLLPVLAGSLMLPYVGGFVLAYVLMALTVLFAAWLVLARTWPALDPAALLFGLAWLLILAAFIGTAREGMDVAFAVNFAMFLLYAPLSAALSRFAGPYNASVVAGLALAGTLIAFAIAFYQSWELLMPRATGFFSDPIWAAQAALIIGFLAVVGLRMPGRWSHILWLGPLLGTLTAFLGQSRGPLVAAPVLLVIGLVFAFKRWWLALPVVAVVGAAAILLAGTLSPDSLLRMETIRTVVQQVYLGEHIDETSTRQRMAFYESSAKAFLDSPLVGHGWRYKIEAIVPHLQDRGAMLKEGHHHLHSDLADFAVSAGLLGILAYLLVIAAPVVGAITSPRDRLYRQRLLGTVLLSAGYASCGMTYLMFGYEFHTTLYVVLSAVLIGFCRERPAARIAGREPATAPRQTAP